MPRSHTCPACGAELSPNAKGCSECGAVRGEEREVESSYDGLDLPDDDDDFDYERFVAEEFGGGKGLQRPAIGWFWWGVAILVLAAFAALVARGLF